MNGTSMTKTTGLALAALFTGLLQAGDFTTLEKDLDVDPVENCKEAIQLYQEGDLKGALDMVALCKDEMEQIKDNLAASSFPDEVLGFRGGELTKGGAMGFSRIERPYNGDNGSIQVSLTSGSGASMMQMAMGFAGRKVRVGRHAATLIEESDETTLFVSHDAGSLSFVSRDLDAKTLKRFAREFLKNFKS